MRQRAGSDTGRCTGIRILCVSIIVLLAAPSCSVRQYAMNRLGDALAGSGTTFAQDDDPELIRAASPFSLKLMESTLEENPSHRGLLLASARGFTQYAYAFVEQDADEIEDESLSKALTLRARARRLYLRARDYGLRGLEVSHHGFTAALRDNPETAVLIVEKEDSALLYWTAASWGSAISLSKTNPRLVADLPQVEALIRRALEVDEEYDSGAIHVFLIALEAGRPGGGGDSMEQSRRHFERAMELSGGASASPLVSLAENVSVSMQDKEEFVDLLQRAIEVDPEAKPEWRLSNLIMQRRAAWLLSRVDELFLD